MANTERALDAALRLQRAAAEEGFDWPDQQGLWDKLAEEIGELRAAATAAEQQEELGDLLFMVLNIARHLQCDAEAALAATNAKFASRWAHVQAGAPWPADAAARLAAMEARWQQAKQLERAAASAKTDGNGG